MEESVMKDADMEKMMRIEAELANIDLQRPATAESGKAKRVSLVVPPSPPAKETKVFPQRPNPLRVNPVDERRPMTSSSKRLSFSSLGSNRRRPIKYGKGKYARVELVPQPSDDDDDPLNWSMWKKELNLASLLMMVALVGVMKTALISVNSRLAMRYMKSYTAVAALTGVPLMVSAFTGMASLIAARLWGKRPVYLAATLFLFVGVVWSTFTIDSFAQCMAARVLQGLGWGAFDTLVLGSIHDTYFEHERGLRIAIHDIVAVGTTWGAPLLGGLASTRATGFAMQFEILTCFMAPAVLLMAFGAPETVFDRSFNMLQTPASAWSMKKLPMRPRRATGVEAVRAYVKTMKPSSYEAPLISRSIVLQAPRALVAPTTALLTLVSLLPLSILWGLSGSLSLLFSSMPFMLRTDMIGVIMTAPWILATSVVAVFAFLPAWHKAFFPTYNTAAIAGGTTFVFAGLLGFGLYIDTCMMAPSNNSAFTVGGVGSKLSFPVVSFVLGLLAAGVYMLDATVKPLIKRSTQFTSSNLGVALRNTADMDSGVSIWRSLFAGVFVMVIPNTVYYWDGLKATSVGFAVAQVFVAGTIGVVWWYFDEHIRRLDGRVMGCMDMSMLKRDGSFFDTD